MTGIEDPFPRPFRSFLVKRVEEQRINKPPRLVFLDSPSFWPELTIYRLPQSPQLPLPAQNDVLATSSTEGPMLQSSEPSFDQHGTFQHPLGGHIAENPGHPQNMLPLPDQQPTYWHDVPVHERRGKVHDFITTNKDSHLQQDILASYDPSMHDFGDVSFGIMDSGLNSPPRNDGQMELDSLFRELHQDSSFPQQTSLPQRRSRYRLRREGQEVRPIQIPVSEPSPNPLQRWQVSPPDEEAAPMAAIIEALDGPENQLSHLGTMDGGKASDARHRKQHSVASSNNSSRSSSTSHLSGTSDRPTGSTNLNLCAKARGAKRRRVEKSKSEKPRVFACTFCCDAFRNKYDWARHEKSVHLNLETWTCAPRDGLVSSPTEEKRCAYCGSPDSTPQHLEEHNHNACAGTSRVFSRKDHLVQHLRVLHRLKEIPPLDTWRREAPYFTCRCGFCDHRLNSWKERADHLAGHFRKGWTMRDWHGEHEFPPSVAALARDCIPPHLIGDDSRSQQPFSASDVRTRDHHEQITTRSNHPRQAMETPAEASSTPQLQNNDRDSSPPRTFSDILARHLAQFARAHMQQGITPTDAMFQLEARRVIYDCEDSWNQTIADNSQWMDSFRRQLFDDVGGPGG